MKLKMLFDHVFDAGTYTSLDYEYADRVFGTGYDLAAPKCTAVMKMTSAGEMLSGRNMDLNISHNPAYVVRTAVPGCYRTVGLTYTFAPGAPVNDEVLANGVSDNFYKQIPFISSDVLNSEGLYTEINMRSGEGSRFVCTGTNPGGKRLYVVLLSRYVGEHCANIAEALEYVKTLDLFTLESGSMAWNFCFMMADATGRYGLLEIACNRLIWHEGQCAQTNFYIDKQLNAMEELKCGLGRYSCVTAGVDKVESEEDMFRLIDKVTYHQIYKREESGFDRRSEFAGFLPHWTTEYLLAEENSAEVKREIDRIVNDNCELTREEKQDKGTLWESTFTEVVNSTKRTLFVRFFEDNEKTLKLGFDETV